METIDAALALIPEGATPVVFHSAVLNYVTPDHRDRSAASLGRHPAVVWISNEGPGVLDGLTTDLRPPASATSSAYFVTARYGASIIGISDPHGSWIR